MPVVQDLVDNVVITKRLTGEEQVIPSRKEGGDDLALLCCGCPQQPDEEVESLPLMVPIAVEILLVCACLLQWYVCGSLPVSFRFKSLRISHYFLD